MVAGRRSSRGCCDGDDRGPEEATVVDAGGGRLRLRLLHQYLDDQMELVGADAGARHAPAAVAVDPTPSSQRSHPQQQ